MHFITPIRKNIKPISGVVAFYKINPNFIIFIFLTMAAKRKSKSKSGKHRHHHKKCSIKMTGELLDLYKRLLAAVGKTTKRKTKKKSSKKKSGSKKKKSSKKKSSGSKSKSTAGGKRKRESL